MEVAIESINVSLSEGKISRQQIAHQVKTANIPK